MTRRSDYLPRKANVDKLNKMNGEVPTSGVADVIVHKPVQMETPSSEKEPSIRAIYEIAELTDDQKYDLVFNEIKNIITADSSSYQGGTIPALIRYDLGDCNIQTILLDIDYRIMNRAWEYYSENVQNPKYPDFINLVRKLKSPDRLIKRVAYLDMA